MNDTLKNQAKLTLAERVKTFFLKIKYGKRLQLKGAVRVQGCLPAIKLPGSQSEINIGAMVVLNSDANNSNTALTNKCTLVCGLQGKITIGDNTMLNGVSITSYESVTIGKNCQIASCTFISDTDFHPVEPLVRERQALGYKFDYNMVNKKPLSIGDNVWIGWGSIILKGVSIGDNSIVAAGSVVLKDVPPNVLVAGNPALVKRILTT